ncbi:MAG: hypothetical protein N2557_08115, partial [Hydrogenophilus sp.]|nr:hypothetical protein [Hydrogenophilus sp.]
VRSLSTDPLSSGAFAATLSFIRRSLLNYRATALVNIIGNSYLTWAFNPELAVEAAAQTPRAIRLLDEYYRTGRVPKEIEGAMYFLHETSLSREARTAVNEAIEKLIREHPEVYQRGSVERFINKLDDWANDLGGRIAEAIGKEDNPYIRLIMPLYTFAYAENVSRLANYLAARKMGADVERALWIASEATFNYADIPYALRLLRQYGLLAFPSFSYFIAKQSLSWAVQRPAALTLPQKTAQASFEEGVDKREDEWRLSVYMPEWLKSTLPMIVPMRTRSGEYIVLPLGRILPMPAISGSTLTEPLNFGILQVFVDAANGVMRYFEDPTGRGIPTLAARYGDTMYRPLSRPEEALRGIAGYVVEKTLPRWLTQFLPGADIPELLTLHLNGLQGKDDIAPLNGVRSLLGKLYVQYTHPAAVAALEERTGRQIGFLAAEAALGFLATPRRISVDIGGVSTRSSIMELERLEARIANSLRDTAVRYGEEEAKKRAEAALQGLRKAMRPYMMLNEALSKYGGE